MLLPGRIFKRSNKLICKRYRMFMLTPQSAAAAAAKQGTSFGDASVSHA